MTFTPEFYELIREGARRSAAVIVPLACDLFEPRRVLDVGAGEGWFARAFAEHGCEVVAVDESAEETHLSVRSSSGGSLSFQPADLTGDAWAYGLRDLAPDLIVCLEVAEHLPPGAADAFVGTLCALGPLVLFSAAIPGQGGLGHLNEQWPAYWVERFERHGFDVSGELRWRIWGSAAEPWYQQNLLVAAHRERANGALSEAARNYGLGEVFGEHAFDAPISVVHPTIWEHRRQRP